MNQRRAGLMAVAQSALLVSVAQLLLKRAAVDLDAIIALFMPSAAPQPPSATALQAAVMLLLGLLCYGLSLLCWLRALGELPLSIAYPLLGVSYPLVYLGSLLLPGFDDHLSLMRCLGLLSVVIGITLLAPRPRGEGEERP
ncbi:MAG: hypothetical protein LBV49_13765 [Azonexus sp.]|jgi:undecaprenyl phosphate-alpha-L-ara4N flippase subunit ArnF|nr:hypothetical protein [Azonexus sp.]